MVTKDDLQKYLEVGIAFTNITRAKAEEVVNDLVRSGDFPSGEARAKVEELLEWSKRGSELLVAQVRHEVSHQLEGVHLEELARQVAALLGRWSTEGPVAETPAHGGSTTQDDVPGSRATVATEKMKKGGGKAKASGVKATKPKSGKAKSGKAKSGKAKSGAGKQKSGKPSAAPSDTGSAD